MLLHNQHPLEQIHFEARKGPGLNISPSSGEQFHPSLLKERGVNDDLAARFAEVMRRCQEAAYAGGGDGDPTLADTALTCLQQLEKERL